MFKNIFDIFKEGSLEYIFTIIIGLFLYVRNGLNKLDLEKNEKDKILLKKYTELFLILKAVPKCESMTDLSNKKDTEINKIVSDIIPYLISSKMQYFLTWKEENKKELLINLKEESRILKINQSYNVIQENEKISIFSVIKNSLYTTRIKNIIITFLYMIFIIIGLLLIFSIVLEYMNGGFNKAFILISKYLFWFFVIDVIYKITNYRLILKKWKLGNNWWKLYLIIIPIGLLVYIVDVLIGFKLAYFVGFIIYSILSLNINNVANYLSNK